MLDELKDTNLDFQKLLRPYLWIIEYKSIPQQDIT
jgi:hypothetical protein